MFGREVGGIGVKQHFAEACVRWVTTSTCPVLFGREVGGIEVKQHCAESGVGWVTAMHKASSIWERGWRDPS
jgi:hypothetical protein